jgi:hypothetical protein
MDKKFLNKVLGQLVRETEIDYVRDKIYPPFTYPGETSFLSSSTFTPILTNIPITPVYLFNPFKKHCEDIYSLKNKDDILYVWTFYRFKMNEKVNKEAYNNPLT